MTSKRQPAQQMARPSGPNGYWIDHALVVEDDFAWLQRVERLTLWNVKLPPGFLARLPKLWWLDMRGGTAVRLESARGAFGLKYLAVNQVRGLTDLSELPTFSQLRFLNLYGIPRVSRLPSLTKLAALERVEIGQMTHLSSLAPILDAPNLRELLLVRSLNVGGADMHRLLTHATLEQFDWFAEDVPDKIWVPVVDAVKLPRTQLLQPEAWFDLHK